LFLQAGFIITAIKLIK